VTLLAIALLQEREPLEGDDLGVAIATGQKTTLS
jgi:hypothetical protein